MPSLAAPLNMPPGIIKEDSDFATAGRYVDGNMVRFWKGRPERWLGWERLCEGALDSPGRGEIEWVNFAGVKLMAFGTANKLWLLVNNATLYDITPVGLPAGLVDSIDTIDVPSPGDYGEGVSPLVAENGGRARTWMLSTWGQDLIAVPRGGTIYHWAGNNPYGTSAVAISGAPSSCLGAFVDADSRHLVAIGANTGMSDDPLFVRWAAQETLTDWTPMETNTAGDQRLQIGNECVGVVSATGAKLIFTDTGLYVFRYVGGDDIMSIKGDDERGVGLIGPRAAATLDGIPAWMSDNGFHSYNGTVQGVDCDVHRYVFNNLNRLQAHKVCAGINRAYRERIWFWPFGDSAENNKFVAVNDKGHWSLGDLVRTSWLDCNTSVKSPVAVDADGVIYRHDTGTLGDGDPISYLLETGDISQDGPGIAGNLNSVISRKIIPDYERMSGDHSITIKAKHYPRSGESIKGPYPYNVDTKQFSVRSRGALHQIRFEGTGDFRMGTIRITTSANGGRG